MEQPQDHRLIVEAFRHGLGLPLEFIAVDAATVDLPGNAG